MKKGKFIVIEGLDGCGKTTQIKAVEAFLVKRGIEVVVMEEPTYVGIGKYIRQRLREGPCNVNRMDDFNREMAYLFAAQRHNTCYSGEHPIDETLDKGKWVLCSRYKYSSYAYHSSSVCDIEFIQQLMGPFIIPDMLIYMNIIVDEAVGRLSHRQTDSYETIEKLTMVKKWYDYIWHDTNGKIDMEFFHSVDATMSIADVTENICDGIKTHLIEG